MMSGFGMGSVLVNYYRKKTDDDDHIPKVRFCWVLNVLALSSPRPHSSCSSSLANPLCSTPRTSRRTRPSRPSTRVQRNRRFTTT